MSHWQPASDHQVCVSAALLAEKCDCLDMLYMDTVNHAWPVECSLHVLVFLSCLKSVEES